MNPRARHELELADAARIVSAGILSGSAVIRHRAPGPTARPGSGHHTAHGIRINPILCAPALLGLRLRISLEKGGGRCGQAPEVSSGEGLHPRRQADKAARPRDALQEEKLG
jgi:hypothetical protein